jgi:hypothetical protein
MTQCEPDRCTSATVSGGDGGVYKAGSTKLEELLVANIRRCLFALACSLIGTATLAAEPFNCEAPVGRNATHAKLSSKYGSANVVTEYDGEADAEV